MKRSIGTLAAALAATLLLGAIAHAATPAEETTRETYVPKVEAICERDAQIGKRILHGARERINRGKLTVAGKQFIRVSATFGKSLRRIVAVPRPPEDDARLRKWFKFLRMVKANLRKVGRALKEGDRVKANHEAIRVERSGNAANNVSFAFSFEHCKMSRSRFR